VFQKAFSEIAVIFEIYRLLIFETYGHPKNFYLAVLRIFRQNFFSNFVVE
jgi:hypothetical protein